MLVRWLLLLCGTAAVGCEVKVSQLCVPCIMPLDVLKHTAGGHGYIDIICVRTTLISARCIAENRHVNGCTTWHQQGVSPFFHSQRQTTVAALLKQPVGVYIGVYISAKGPSPAHVVRQQLPAHWHHNSPATSSCRDRATPQSRFGPAFKTCTIFRLQSPNAVQPQ